MTKYLAVFLMESKLSLLSTSWLLDSIITYYSNIRVIPGEIIREIQVVNINRKIWESVEGFVKES